MSPQSVTFHSVLAGAYKSERAATLASTLTHASQDGGHTALCGRVKAGNLCDVHEVELTCPVCTKRVAALSARGKATDA